MSSFTALPTSTALKAASHPAQDTITDLLQRMRGNDRGAAAEFLLRYEAQLRRRIRSKLGPDVRRLFDSMDIVSTLGRRLDQFVKSGGMRVDSADACLSLLSKMADRALIDKLRIFRRLARVEGEDSEFARSLAARLRQAERRARSGVETEVENCLRLLDDPIDRRILSLWLTDESLAAIAEMVRLSPLAVRKRWQVIRESLRDRLARMAS